MNRIEQQQILDIAMFFQRRRDKTRFGGQRWHGQARQRRKRLNNHLGLEERPNELAHGRINLLSFTAIAVAELADDFLD